jgi:hypothetical protein
MAGVKGRSGGRRSGTGSKLSAARVLGLIGPKGTAEPTPIAEIACPEGLSPDVAAIWAELAEHALKARTLVPSTVTAFTRLCKAVVRHAEMERQIAADGYTYLKISIDGAGTEHQEVKAHPLITRASSLDNTIRAWLKDFAIHPFGKPLVSQEAVQDDFDEFDRPQLVRGA